MFWILAEALQIKFEIVAQQSSPLLSYTSCRYLPDVLYFPEDLFSVIHWTMKDDKWL